MGKLGLARVYLDYEADTQFLEPNDADYYDDLMQFRSAKVMGVPQGADEDDEEEPAAVELGSISGYLFLFGGALNAGIDLVREADNWSQDSYGAAEVLRYLYEDDDWRMDSFNHNGLYIHEMFIKPEYRGCRLGEVVLRRFVDRVDPSSLFAIVLCPNSRYFFENKKETASDPLYGLDKAPAQAKLEAWYKSLGFKKLVDEIPGLPEGENDFHFWGMDGDQHSPNWRFHTKKPKKRTRKAKTAASTAKSGAAL